MGKVERKASNPNREVLMRHTTILTAAILAILFGGMVRFMDPSGNTQTYHTWDSGTGDVYVYRSTPDPVYIPVHPGSGGQRGYDAYVGVGLYPGPPVGGIQFIPIPDVRDMAPNPNPW
jgi:hypothetical protein